MNQFYNKIKAMAKGIKINIYIDMDGVVADYDMIDHKIHGSEKDVYLNKRPIKTTINIIEKLSHIDNVELYIFSVSRLNNQIGGKIKWLDKNMPFIKRGNIIILSREDNNFDEPSIIKSKYYKNNPIDEKAVNIHIDDSHNVLKAIDKLDKEIIPLHISSILD